MATKKKFFTTDISKPTPPNVGEIASDFSIKDVVKLDPKIKLSLGKSSGICISTDADLSKARSLIGLNVTSKMFGMPGLLTRSPVLPSLNCPITNLSPTAPLDALISASDSALDTLEHMQSRYDIGSTIKSLCELLGIDCPTCDPWPDLLGDLNIAKYHVQFMEILDRLLEFGDPDLFTMFARCPEYLMKASFKQLKDMADMMSIDGQLKMFDTLVEIVQPERIAGLEKVVRNLAGSASQSADDIVDFDSILSIVSMTKQDLVTVGVLGLDGTTVYDTTRVSEGTANGVDVLSPDEDTATNLRMVGSVGTLIASRPTPVTQDPIPGTWVDESGYIHVMSSNIPVEKMQEILRNNAKVRAPKKRKPLSQVLDLRNNPGPLDLNGCAAF